MIITGCIREHLTDMSKTIEIMFMRERENKTISLGIINKIDTKETTIIVQTRDIIIIDIETIDVIIIINKIIKTDMNIIITNSIIMKKEEANLKIKK